mmetsp:Transcript_32604/g.62897  ORF Transcript_32604/g.62897 Transcript_32604/m.62897 type:complete len:97 (-) Transcript_32604:12-302(-)
MQPETLLMQNRMVWISLPPRRNDKDSRFSKMFSGIHKKIMVHSMIRYFREMCGLCAIDQYHHNATDEHITLSTATPSKGSSVYPRRRIGKSPGIAV